MTTDHYPAQQEQEPRHELDLAVLRGDLAWVHIGGVLQVLEAQSLSGWLSLPGGELRIFEGRYAGARFEDAQGVDAMVRILSLDQGSFAFHCGVLEECDTHDLSTMLMRCGQALDDWWRLSGEVVLVPEAERTSPILKMLDGSMTLAEAVVETGISFVKAVEAVADAMDFGGAHVVEQQQTVDDLIDFMFVD